MAEDRREEFHVGDRPKEMKEGSLRERVRCSSLVDWPVYSRLRGDYAGLNALPQSNCVRLHVGVEERCHPRPSEAIHSHSESYSDVHREGRQV